MVLPLTHCVYTQQIPSIFSLSLSPLLFLKLQSFVYLFIFLLSFFLSFVCLFVYLFASLFVFFLFGFSRCAVVLELISRLHKVNTNAKVSTSEHCYQLEYERIDKIYYRASKSEQSETQIKSIKIIIKYINIVLECSIYLSIYFLYGSRCFSFLFFCPLSAMCAYVVVAFFASSFGDVVLFIIFYLSGSFYFSGARISSFLLFRHFHQQFI